MAAIFYDSWPWLKDYLSSPDYEDKLLIRSNILTPALCLTYFFTVRYIGPSFMMNRKPFNVQPLIILYNFSMVIFNLSAAIGFWKGFQVPFPDFLCPTDPTMFTRLVVETVRVHTWRFFLLKLVEFTDSIFFVLRKRFDLLTALHVLHHTVTPMAYHYFARNYLSICFFAFVLFNSSVHVVMYFYYGLAACGPKFRKFLWWKKYVTALQIVQLFVIVSCVCSNFLTGCYPTRSPELTLMSITAFFLILFVNYFVRQFVKRTRED